MPPGRRERKVHYVPGLGNISHSQYYRLRKEELARQERLFATASSTSAGATAMGPASGSTPLLSIRQDTSSESAAIATPQVAIIYPSHDDDAHVTPQPENDLPLPSTSAPTVDHSSVLSTGPALPAVISVDATSVLNGEPDDDDDVHEIDCGEMRTYYLMEDDDEDVDEEFDEEERGSRLMRGMTLEQLKVELALWMSNSRSATRNSRALLKLLREADPHSVFASLPKDPRSLLPKPNPGTVPVPRPLHPGEYAYLGVRRTLVANPSLYDQNASALSLMFHIDGVPLFHSSPVKFWPTLASFRKKPVFLVALFIGEKDPKCAHDYLRDFIDEVTPYLSAGIEVAGKVYTFHIHCLLADAPARAFLLGIKFPTGYYSCSKCKIPGCRCEGRTCFPCVDDYSTRTTANFYEDTDNERAEKSAQDCPLARIPGFDFVNGVVLDSMHLIYLGVVKRTIETWLGLATGFKRVISCGQVTLANERIRKLTEYYPADFQRAPRPLSLLPYWRAHEFRQFVLYNVYAVMHDILSDDHLEHVLLLQMFCRLLMLNANNDSSVIEYCVQLAKIFVTKSCELFGDHWAVYNAHGLIHVPEDVYRYAGVEEVSCFKFESFLFFIKRLVRSGRLPLKQAINRYLEWLAGCERLATFGTANAGDSREAGVRSQFEPTHNITFAEDCHPDYVTYRRLRTATTVLRGDRLGDQCCIVSGKHVVEISHFARSKVDSKLYIVGRKYGSVLPLYNFFTDSSEAEIFRCANLSTKVDWFAITDEGNATHDGVHLRKMYRVPLFGTEDVVCSTMLHEL